MLFIFISNGSVEADIRVRATTNNNTTNKDDVIDELISGLDSSLGEALNVIAIVVLGRQEGLSS